MAEDQENRIAVINPADYRKLLDELISESNAFPSPPTEPVPGEVGRLWGIPVVVSDQMPVGKAIMGDLGRIDTTMRCPCCGTRASKAGCFGGGYPVCVCYLQSGTEGPKLCSDCEYCAFHHNGLPFGACQKSDLAQRVIRVRIAEQKKREGQAEEIDSSWFLRMRSQTAR